MSNQDFRVKGVSNKAEETKNASSNQGEKVRQFFEENPEVVLNLVIGHAIKARLLKALAPVINVYQTVPRITKQVIISTALMAFVSCSYMKDLDYFFMFAAYAVVLSVVSFIWQSAAMKASESSPATINVGAPKNAPSVNQPPVENRPPARHTPTAEYISPLDYQETVEIQAMTTNQAIDLLAYGELRQLSSLYLSLNLFHFG
jgi:hypothetical protein